MGIILSWLALSLLIGIVGSSKSCGFATAFFVSLFLSPIGGLIVLANAKDNSTNKFETQLIDLQKQNVKYSQSDNALIELGRLQLLLDSGMITIDEYNSKKKLILVG